MTDQHRAPCPYHSTFANGMRLYGPQSPVLHGLRRAHQGRRMSREEQVEALAEVIDRADDRWQHGIGSGGYDVSGPVLGIPIRALADAILDSPAFRTILADAWDEGWDEYDGYVGGTGVPAPTANGEDRG